jgi:hypothetical protein
MVSSVPEHAHYLAAGETQPLYGSKGQEQLQMARIISLEILLFVFI